ncbi:uncharacterized protein LOC126678651 [Mercurialis annua]|uniref:uncharacterized protein LOC126678651 n=1 Tax=Mercurialis annua TaxID=3986 RepID=UPI00215E55A7|nr:uncharacterized protein LOC126678651 [Mercurialis annua]
MDILSLCESLSLSDDEDIVVCNLGDEARLVGEQKVALSLVGKILTTKRVNREGIINTVNFLWRTKKPLVVEVIGINIFVVHFESQEDKRRVLAGGPWNYQEQIIVLEIPRGTGDYAEMKFDTIPFWIQIHGLPLICLNKEAGRSLGSQIGVVEEVDLGASGDCLGKYLRVKIKVNITKPLKRGLKVQVDKDSKMVVTALRYERLPELCYNCGILGHPLVECGKTQGSEPSNLRYNDLIRAGSNPRLGSSSKRVRSGENVHIGIGTSGNWKNWPLMNKGSSEKVEKETNVDSGDRGAKSGTVTENQEIDVQKDPHDHNLNLESGERSVTEGDLVEVCVNKVYENSIFEKLARSKKKGKMDDGPKSRPKLKARQRGMKKPTGKSSPGNIKINDDLLTSIPLGDITNLGKKSIGFSCDLIDGAANGGSRGEPGELSQSRDCNFGEDTNVLSVVPAVQDRRSQ